jgi:hypothetical protein
VGEVLAGLAIRAALALGLLEVVVLGTWMGAGAAFAKYSASGTTIMPTSTVTTNVTAPHSRRRTAQFTSGEFYRD